MRDAQLILVNIYWALNLKSPSCPHEKRPRVELRGTKITLGLPEFKSEKDEVGLKMLLKFHIK